VPPSRCELFTVVLDLEGRILWAAREYRRQYEVIGSVSSLQRLEQWGLRALVSLQGRLLFYIQE
jgi:hypothetical protein